MNIQREITISTLDEMCELMCGEVEDIDCNDCIHLNITEEEQSKDKEPHICKFYNKRVRHMDCNYYLYSCKECNRDGFENYEYRYEKEVEE